MYGDSAVLKIQLFKCHKGFSQGREEVCDDIQLCPVDNNENAEEACQLVC
jgi:hypothetical protein